ncbi:NAD(P)-dependent oxidoreductase [Chloroflexota bacterium]
MMTRKVRIGITRDMFDKDGVFFTPGPGLKLLDDMPNVEWAMFPDFQPVITTEQVKEFDIVISLRPQWAKPGLSASDHFAAVLRSGVGFDDVNVPDMTDLGIIVCNTPIAVRRPLATAIIGFILMLSLNMEKKKNATRENRWADRADIMGEGVVGKTLGSVGVGGIGHEMFNLAGQFDMKHIAYDPFLTQEQVNDVGVTLVDLDTVLKESDFLSLSFPLDEKTFHFISEKEIRKMKESAYLINTARGSCVDEQALIKALNEGWIKGAAIDVFEQEPTYPDNPLLRMDNVITTGHCVGWTDQVWSAKWDENIEQISHIIRGEIPNALVNKEVWDSPECRARMKRLLEEIV